MTPRGSYPNPKGRRPLVFTFSRGRNGEKSFASAQIFPCTTFFITSSCLRAKFDCLSENTFEVECPAGYQPIRPLSLLMDHNLQKVEVHLAPITFDEKSTIISCRSTHLKSFVCMKRQRTTNVRKNEGAQEYTSRSPYLSREFHFKFHVIPPGSTWEQVLANWYQIDPSFDLAYPSAAQRFPRTFLV